MRHSEAHFILQEGVLKTIISKRWILIYLCIHEKRSPWDCVTQLLKNPIFKALLRIKKSFKSIDFDVAKHVLVFNVDYRRNLFKKFQILRLKWTYWEANLATAS